MDSIVSERLKKALDDRSLKQADLARITGISKGSISGYVNGSFKPKDDNIEAMAKALHVSADWLLGKTDDPTRRASHAAIKAGVGTNKGAVRIPVFPAIAGGIPIEAAEDYIDDNNPDTWEEIPGEWLNGGQEYFAVRVHGESMAPKISDGAIAIIRKCYEWHDGKIMAVYVNGYKATLKRVRLKDGGIVALESLNPDPEYETQIYTAQEVKSLPVRPCGILRQIRDDYE